MLLKVLPVIFFAQIGLAAADEIALNPRSAAQLELPKAPRAKLIKSEYFYQAAKNQTLVSPSVDYNSQGGDYRYTTGAIRDFSTTYNIVMEYGFSNGFAAALKIGYVDGATEMPGLKVDNQGMNDVKLTLRGRRMIGENSEALFGAYLFHSLEDKSAKVRFNLAAPSRPTPVSTQPQSGGDSAHVYMGYQRLAGTSVLGTRLIQSVYGTKRTTKVNVIDAPTFVAPNGIPEKTLEERGGGVTDLSVFYERPINNWTLGAAVSYRRIGVIEQITPARVTTSEAMQFVGLELTPTLHLPMANFDIVGLVKYRRLVESNILYNGQRLSSGDIFDVSVGGRYLF